MSAHRYSTLTLYRRLFALAAPCWPQMAALFVLSLVSAPLALLAPVPLKIVVDSVVGSAPLPGLLAILLPRQLAGTPGAALVAAVALVLVVALANQLQGVASWLLQTYTGELLLLRFRSQLFAHVQRLSLKYHDTRGSADAG